MQAIQIEETRMREITIDYADNHLGIEKFEAFVCLDMYNADGSRIILLQVPSQQPNT